MITARKPGHLHRLGLGAAMIAVAAAPLAMAVPASAATASSGCIVEPLKPTSSGVNAAGVKLVRYDVQVACSGNRVIEVHQQLFEDDVPPNPDDFTGSQVSSLAFVGADITTKGITRTLANTESGREEVYQRARFRVSVAGAPFTAWTTFEATANLSIAN